MVATLPLPALLDALRRVGVELQLVTEGGNLYLWHTPAPEYALLYTGKAASDTRTRQEQTWKDNDDPNIEILSGIITLLRVNRGALQLFRYVPDTFDANRWKVIRDKHGWEGKALDNLEAALPDGTPLPATEVEKLIVRIAVRYGVPIGNSQFASQWETPIGSISDTLAALAVLGDESFEVP
ncbi:hypothetical protein [Nocardia tengchongensis]|uniref:hypothetical protein n=1 Tax=Nocardia tengchongensis TaxID=2055889 RepID=UPI0036C2619C